MSFTLDKRLEADTFFVTDLPLCRVLLMDNALFPWLILVPRIADAVEWFDVPDDQQAQLLAEIKSTSEALTAHCDVEKLNIAALGNVVSQLHIHIVGRNNSDAAWPAPVWNNGQESYKSPPDTLIKALRTFLTDK